MGNQQEDDTAVIFRRNRRDAYYPKIQLHSPFWKSQSNHLKLVVRNAWITTKDTDLQAFENPAHSCAFRNYRDICDRYLKKWPSPANFNCTHLMDVIRLIDDVNALLRDAVIIDQIHAGGNITSGQWARIQTERRRESQIGYHYDRNKTEYAVEVPAVYSCSRCLTNDHSTKSCRKKPKCLKCGVMGHFSYKCFWQLCSRCSLYGHGRQICSSPYMLCSKCGGDDHFKSICTSNKLYCRLCGGDHAMIDCSKYDGSCFEHCGRHSYDKCPDRNRRRGRC